MPVALLMPGAAAGEWELCRTTPTGGLLPVGPGVPAVTRQVFETMDAAAANLQLAEAFVLSLPVETGLVQRLSLPAAEPGELEEMVRIQLEKILPYPVESVNIAVQEVARTENEVVVAVETVHQDRLLTLCQPLVAQEHWPVRVVFHALVLAESTKADEHAAFIYREAGRYVLGISEGGRLSFAQALSGQTAGELTAELPAVLLGAELEGVLTTFQTVRLDQAAEDARETLAVALSRPVETFNPGAAALAASEGEAGDLSPSHWRTERLRGERMARLRQRVLLGAAIYGVMLVLAFLWLGVLKFQVSRLDSKLAAIRPVAAEAQAADAHWRTLAPAIQPPRYLVEAAQQIYDCLPPGDTVRWTAIDFTPRSIALQGEAPSASEAVDFTDKLKVNPALRAYHLEAEPPTSLPSGRVVFRIKGSLP